VDGEERWPGQVLARQRSAGGWLGLVRFSRMTADGWPLTYEHWLDAADLEPV